MLYWGIVLDINDPMKLQRVKVRVTGYYDNIPESDLPWCQVLRDGINALTFNIGPSHHNLIKGSQVLIAFLDTYMQQPIVLGSIPRVGDCDNTSLTNQKIPTKSGHIITIDDGDNPYIEITDASQNNIKLDKTGIIISTPKKLEENITGELNINSQKLNIKILGTTNIESTGNVNLTSNGEVNIKGSKINLN